MATDMHYGAAKNIFQYAELLRKNMTAAEKMLWDRFYKNQLGVRIRRQHPIGKYIVDFYCHEAKLIKEIDGDIHLIKENKEYDIGREVCLNEFGIEIIRFTNDEVMNNVEEVIQKIKSKIEQRRKNNQPSKT
ncbi:MAG: endonuclease domain-containing protein [Bacteroidota bacterium]|nr:endonuclease domain-containing protein [Bacteroidota bacterium]